VKQNCQLANARKLGYGDLPIRIDGKAQLVYVKLIIPDKGGKSGRQSSAWPRKAQALFVKNFMIGHW
jgi:hypothetical protein